MTAQNRTGGNSATKNLLLFAAVAALFIGTGFVLSWNSSLGILNMALISAIMAMGVNLQWGYAGLFNVGVMGFVALGGLAVVITSSAPLPDAWRAGGPGIVLGLALGAATIGAAIVAYRKLPQGRLRGIGMLVVLVVGFIAYRAVFDPAATAVEANSPA